jgi:nucleolin
MGSVKRTAAVVEEVLNADAEAEALAAKKAAKKAKKTAAAAAVEAEAPPQEDEEAARIAKKASRKAKKAIDAEAAAGVEAEAAPQEDEEAARIAKKAAKKAKKAAEAEAAAAVVEAEAAPQEDEEAARIARKAAKKAKKAAEAEAEAAAVEVEVAPQEDEDAARVARKAAKKAKKAGEAIAAAAEEEEEEEGVPAPKKEKDTKKATADVVAEGEAPKKVHDNDNTVFVRGLPFATTEEALKKDFAECGELVSLKMPLNDEGYCKGIAFVKYTSKEGMDKALAFNETDYGGRTVYVSPAADKPEGKGKGKDGKGKGKGKDGKDGGQNRDENTVFVRGLPFETTEETLKKDFTECGEISSLRMPLNDEGACRGIAFIKYSDKVGMEKAMKFNETDYGGRTIFVSDAADKPKGKGKDGKDGKGKDGKAKGKGKKGKGKAPSEAFAKTSGVMVESTGTKQTFEDSDDE